jgi:hypothetical protein
MSSFSTSGVLGEGIGLVILYSSVLVGAVLDHFEEEEHGDVLLPSRSRVTEAMAFRELKRSNLSHANPGTVKEKIGEF